MSGARAATVSALAVTGARAALLVASALGAAAMLSGCGSERIEYRYRPAYMTDANSPKEMTLPDGTKVIFVDHETGLSTIDRDLGRGKESAEPVLGPDGKPVPQKVFEPREQLEDGTIVLRNLFPDHVIANAMTCFRNEEYELMWEQLLAPEARATYKGEHASEEFAQWCRENRRATMELLNRMRFNALGSDVAMKRLSPTRMRATLAPHLWEQFSLRVIEFESTPDGMKLLSIRTEP